MNLPSIIPKNHPRKLSLKGIQKRCHKPSMAKKLLNCLKFFHSYGLIKKAGEHFPRPFALDLNAEMRRESAYLIGFLLGANMSYSPVNHHLSLQNVRKSFSSCIFAQ